MLHFIYPGTSQVWTKHYVSISDVRVSNKEVLDNVVAHHVFEVSLRCMANHSLGFASEFGCSNLFLGEPFKKFPGYLYEGHVLFFGHQCMVDPLHTC